MALRVRPIANCSKAADAENKTSNNAPSPHAPKAAVAGTTSSIKKCVVNSNRLNSAHVSRARSQPPARKAAQ